ncbi:hypothetical protein OsI_26210 [Oryza sativa Indica Group]|uniref:AAA-type ATPase N-terminal domain-containing protein n=1 Tax=Oryza sativa subsp. indica TaxID=39946 RepID=A2YLW0_ORYSI|nr:hypothetical protein OsI_26210 [Oryza sativa Indica Group]
MDHHRLPLAAAGASESERGRALSAYRKALATAASVAAYSVIARDLLPDELRAAVRRAARLVWARLFAAAAAEKKKKRRTLVIRRRYADGDTNLLFRSAREYMATKMVPGDMPRLAVAASYRRKEADGSWSWRARLCVVPGDSATDVFDGVEFKWAFVETGRDGDDGDGKSGGHRDKLFEVTFDAEHMSMALDRYIPFVMATVDQMNRPTRALTISMNRGGSWHGFNHHHPATFDTIAMEPDLKTSRHDDAAAAAAADLDSDDSDYDDSDESEPKVRQMQPQPQQNVTLSGLLNFIDGLVGCGRRAVSSASSCSPPTTRSASNFAKLGWHGSNKPIK